MVVIVDRIYYMSSMYEIVNDTPKFLRLRSDPTICRENKLQRFLRSLKSLVFFTKDVYDNIYPCQSKPARIYGNPKTHKLKCKTDMLTFHHIVSSIGTYNYKLEKISWRTIESNYSITILCYRFLLFLQRNTRGKYIWQIHDILWCP